jgi:hypothetical protein
MNMCDNNILSDESKMREHLARVVSTDSSRLLRTAALRHLKEPV